MTRYLVAAITALFLGAVATEIHSRLFAGRYFPMLMLTVIAVFVGAVVTNRIVARERSTTVRSTRRATFEPPETVRRSDRIEREVEPERTESSDADVATTDAELETGRVKWFNRTKGFGFIIRDNGGGEVFVHHRNIRGNGRRSLKDGELVRFRVAAHDKGLQAEDVSVVRES